MTSQPSLQATNPLGIQPLATAVRSFERQHLLRALSLCRGNKTETAKRLGISRKNLWEKLRRHSVSDGEIRQEIAAAHRIAMDQSL